MDWGTVLSGVGGGLKGGLDVYSWQKEMQQKDRALENQKEMAKIRAEFQQVVALINAGSREKVAAGNNETKIKTSVDAEFGKNMRWKTPSGNVIAQQEGANKRHDTVSGDTAATIGQRAAEETGRNTRWGTPSGNARLGAATTTRGQDVAAATSRYGQDLNFTLGTDRNAIDVRGQDINYGVQTAAEAGRNTRARSLYDHVFDDPNATAPAEPVAAPPPPPPPFVPGARPGGVGMPGAPLPAPVAPRPPAGVTPITPRAAAPAAVAPKPPAAQPPAMGLSVTRRDVVRPAPPQPTAPTAPAVDPRAQLASAVSAKLAQFMAEKDPQRKQAIGAELAALRQQILALKGAK